MYGYKSICRWSVSENLIQAIGSVVSGKVDFWKVLDGDNNLNVGVSAADK